MRIFAFHLLNDYSGSPKVLSQLLKGWTKNNIEVHMVTCSGREGFLSDIPKVKYHYYPYKFAVNPYLRLYRLIMSQLFVVWKMLFLLKKEDIVYVNTVLPFAGAFIGKIKGCKIVYHIHETTMKPALLKRFLFGVARWSANDAIFVSKYLANQEPFPKSKAHILHNAIENDFLSKAIENRIQKTKPHNILLVCSLKEYKGVNEFVTLSDNLPNYQFKLVVNANKQEIDLYFKEINVPVNLEIYATQTNLHPFYQWADLIVNFSKPAGWIETFGLTIIEGMAYGLPAIVPIIGGITELIEEDINGFQIDSENLTLLIEKIETLFNNQSLYLFMSDKTKEKIKQYEEINFIQQNIEIVK
jgi:L-malate glycosyltransferase